MDRLARAVQRRFAPPERDQPEELVDTVDGERVLDRLGGARRGLRVPPVHRGLVRLAARPEPGGAVVGPRPRRARRVDARAARRPRGRRRPSNQSSRTSRRRRLGVRPMIGRVVAGRLDDRRDPAVQPADVTEEIGDLPLGTRRHARVDARGARGGRERVTLAAKRGAVLGVVHQRRGYFDARSSSSGPLLSALFTSVDTGHISSSAAGDGTSSSCNARGVVVVDVEPRVPRRLRAARPACDRGSARATRWGRS